MCRSFFFFWLLKNPSAFQTSFTLLTINMHLSCLHAVFHWLSLDEHLYFSSHLTPLVSLSQHQCLFTLLFLCRFSSLLASFESPRIDSTLSLSDLPSCWLQLLLTARRSWHLRVSFFFSCFPPAARFHTSTYRTICSWSVYATPSLLPMPSFIPLSCPHAENRC